MDSHWSLFVKLYKIRLDNVDYPFSYNTKINYPTVFLHTTLFRGLVIIDMFLLSDI
jgi:hypothetical protein